MASTAIEPPYPARTVSTRSNGGSPCTEECRYDSLVSADLRRRAFSDLRTKVQDGDAVAKGHDEIHMVLDEHGSHPRFSEVA